MTDGAPSRPLRSKEDIEVLREAVTMALYISLSLLAVLAAVPSDIIGEPSAVAFTVGLTSLGLVLAHQVAFRLSTRLLHHGILSPTERRLLGAQLLGGLAVTFVAVLPIVIFGSDALPWTFLLLLAFVAVVGYTAARSVPLGRGRSLLYVAGVIVVALGVLIIKLLVGH